MHIAEEILRSKGDLSASPASGEVRRRIEGIWGEDGVVGKR